MAPEASLEPTASGLVPAGEGWFVLNAHEARWSHREGRGESLRFDGDTEFPQVGINLFVLAPGEPMGMYHWEADQEAFLVLSGEPLLIIEGEERPLQPWDFVHCPAKAEHIIVGAGDRPCAVLAVGAREHQAGADWGGYTVDEAALRHGAGVEQETADAEDAYSRHPEPVPARYRDGWLPGRRMCCASVGFASKRRPSRRATSGGPKSRSCSTPPHAHPVAYVEAGGSMIDVDDRGHGVQELPCPMVKPLLRGSRSARSSGC